MSSNVWRSLGALVLETRPKRKGEPEHDTERVPTLGKPHEPEDDGESDDDLFAMAHAAGNPTGATRDLPKPTGMSPSQAGSAQLMKQRASEPSSAGVDVPRSPSTRSTISRRLGVSPDAYFNLADPDVRRRGRPSKLAGQTTPGELPKIGATKVSDLQPPSRPGRFGGEVVRHAGYSSLHPKDVEAGLRAKELFDAGDKGEANKVINAKPEDDGPNDKEAAVWVMKNPELAKKLQRGNPSSVDPKGIRYGNQATGKMQRGSVQPSAKDKVEWVWDDDEKRWMTPIQFKAKHARRQGEARVVDGALQIWEGYEWVSPSVYVSRLAEAFTKGK